jgi:DNA-binding Xre family transcriptional regulator
MQSQLKQGDIESVRRRGKSKEVPLADEEQIAQKNLKRLWELNAGKLGITQRGLAKTYEVNPSYISQLKNGFVPINLNWLMRMSKALRVQPEDIMPGYKEFFNVGEFRPAKAGVTLQLVAVKRKGNADIMATLTRDTINYPLFGNAETKAIEVLDDARHALEIQFGTHVVFDETPATGADRLAVGILNENPSHYRIVVLDGTDRRDVFDGEIVNRGWSFKRVKALVYNA